jgi:branched-chain amino acid transport system permease protein
MADPSMSLVQGVPMPFHLRGRRYLPWAIGAVILAALPFVLEDYYVFQLTLMMATAMALLGLNLLTGFNGQISLGHGAFFAIGAYTAAILMDKFSVAYWLAIPVAGIVCLGFGILFGLPALRLEGHYLAVATFALAVALPQLLKHKYLADWTGGVQGTTLSKPSAPFRLDLSQDQWLYFFSLAVLLLGFLCARNLLKSHVGRAMIAIRDQPIAAAAMGIDVARYKTLTFGVSALYTGVGGALMAIGVQFVAPDSFSYFVSINFLVGMVVGGIAQLPGAIYGAAFVHAVPHLTESISKNATGVIFGLIVIAVIYVMPFGINGFILRISARLRATVQRRGS